MKLLLTLTFANGQKQFLEGGSKEDFNFWVENSKGSNYTYTISTIKGGK